MIDIPADFGQGGANIGDGNPKLGPILTEHRAAILASPYLTVCVPDQTGPHRFSLGGAVAGRKVVSATCITVADPGFGSCEADFEGEVSQDNTILQTSNADHTNSVILFLLAGPNPNGV